MSIEFWFFWALALILVGFGVYQGVKLSRDTKRLSDQLHGRKVRGRRRATTK